MQFKDALLEINITKHLPGKHNQKDHTPYGKRSEHWSSSTHLPYKSEYKGKGLASQYEAARNPQFNQLLAAKASAKAGVKTPSSASQTQAAKYVDVYTKEYMKNKTGAANVASLANKVGMSQEEAVNNPEKFTQKIKEASKNFTEEDINNLNSYQAFHVAAANGMKPGLKTTSKVKEELVEQLVTNASKAKTPKEALAETADATGTKGKAAAKTAAAVMAASKTPDDEPRQVVSTIPKASELTLKPGAHAGGTGEKYTYVDQDGNEYLFKPSVAKNGNSEPFRADVQEAASKLGRMVRESPLDSIEVRKITLQGKEGTIQKLVPNQGTLDAKTVDKLTDKQRNDLLQEHTVDWLLGNFDSHAGNFVEMRNGRVIGIDKEQSFRYINDKDSQHMGTTYAPNKGYGTKDPVYNALFQGHADGKYSLDLQGLEKQVKRVEAIPDDKYRKMFQPYAESLHGKGTKEANDLLDQIVTRKQNLRTEYESMFSTLEGKANNSQVTFKFGEKSASKPKINADHKHSDNAPDPFKGKTTKEIASKGPAYWETVLTHSTAAQIKGLASELGVKDKGNLGDTQAAISAHYKSVAGKGASKTNFPDKADLQGLSKESLKNLAFKEGLVDANSNKHKYEYVNILDKHFRDKLADTKPGAAVSSPTDLKAMKVTDLAAKAKAMGLKGYSGKTKAELIEMIQSGSSAPKGVKAPADFKGTSLWDNGKFIGSITHNEELNTSKTGSHEKLWGESTLYKTIDHSKATVKVMEFADSIGVKVTKAQASAMVTGVDKFTGPHSSSIRKAQLNAYKGKSPDPNYKSELKWGQNADKLIELAPKWNGNGTMYRKIKVGPNDTDFWNSHKVGAIITQQHGTSSWTSQEGVWSGNVQFIMSGGSMMSTSVMGISQHHGEHEVLMHSGAKQYIEKIEKVGGGLTKIYVTEVPPVTPSAVTIHKSSDVLYYNQITKEGAVVKDKDKIKDLGVRDALPDDEGSAAYDPATGEWVGSDGLRYKVENYNPYEEPKAEE